ncbi:MAG: hypothetical protein Q8Q59_13925 [Luteolibacter sp.]|jgi:hypothetical protein|nr:hypothetical protein [Luteolibacter sp.]
MKLPLILTLIIVAAGSFWGVQENRKLTTLREKHRLVLKEAVALGVSADASKPIVPTKITKRPREDAELKVKGFTERLVAFAKEMKEMQTSGKQPDETARKRMMEMMDDMLSLNSEELKALIATLKGRQDMDDEMKKGMISFSIIMLAQQNPEAALAFFTESSELLGDEPMSKHALTAALSQWAQDQPLAALEWIKKNAEKHPDLVTKEAKAAVIAGAARNDFALALQLIGELKVPVDEGMVISQITRAATTPEQQSELLKALRKQAGNSTDKKEGEKLLTMGLRNLFGQVTESGHDKSMDWLKSANLSAAETGDMVQGLIYNRTKADTGKWLEWLSSQPIDGKKSENTTRNLVRQWTDTDYKAAGEWLAQAPAGPIKETATISYLETIAPYEPEVAAQWADTLPAAKQKDAMNHIYQNLKNKDQPAAEAFATKHGLDVRK